MALGTELPALFTNNDNLGEDIINEGIKQIDPMWNCLYLNLIINNLIKIIMQ